MSLSKEKKSSLVKEFGINPNDTGSVQLQIAMLSERVTELTAHMQENKKDFSTKRGLLKILSRRRTFLNHLEQTDENIYRDMIKRLGLKK